MRKLIAIILVLSTFLTGCGEVKSFSTKATNIYGGSSISVLDIKKKYSSENDKAIMPMYNVANDNKFTFNFQSDLSNISNIREIISVHTDSKCLDASKLFVSELPNSYVGNTSITVGPSLPVLASEKNKNITTSTWGNAPIYYIRINYDLDSKTPKKLNNPIIIPFTIKSELPVPNLRKEISSDGSIKLVWDKIDGAEKYNIYQVSNPTLLKATNTPTSTAETGYSGYPHLQETVTTTVWDNFLGSGKGSLIKTGDDKTNDCVISGENQGVDGDYYVTAVAGDKESNFSKPVSTPALSTQLPHDIKDYIAFSTYDSAKDLPKTVAIEYIDGSIQNKDVIYDTTHISSNEINHTTLYFTIKDTAFKGYLYVNNFKDADKQTLVSSSTKDTSQGYIAPQNSTADVPNPNVPTIINDNSSKNKDNSVAHQEQNTKQQVDSGDKSQITVPAIANDVPVNADSAFESYLALKLINGDTNISLQAFPEVQTGDTIKDTLEKVIYQNPLILGVKGFGYDYSKLTLNIKYADSSETIKKKQQEIAAQAKKVVSSVIKSGTSDEVKRKALYDYLDKNTKYDKDALKSAEANNFKSVASEYNDSFTTYGILIKKVGVCQSYANTYKLLCDLSNLKCIVVTGTIKNEPHAWNKVAIDNEWLNVDCTNNSTNSGIPYFLFESNDATAKKLSYAEDNSFWIDSSIKKFDAKTNSHDYYTVNKLEANDIDAYSTELSDQLTKGNKNIIIRLNFNADNKTIVNAIGTVMTKVAKDKIDTSQLASCGSYVELITK